MTNEGKMNELDELRLQIARERGYKRQPTTIEEAAGLMWERVTDSWYDGHDFVQLGDDDGGSVLFTPPIGWKYLRDFPDWPRDIAAAWELVGEMGNAYFSLAHTNATGWAPAPWGDMHWECRFYAPEKGARQGITAPEAICRAWLAWKTQGEAK